MIRHKVIDRQFARIRGLLLSAQTWTDRDGVRRTEALRTHPLRRWNNHKSMLQLLQYRPTLELSYQS